MENVATKKKEGKKGTKIIFSHSGVLPEKGIKSVYSDFLADDCHNSRKRNFMRISSINEVFSDCLISH